MLPLCHFIDYKSEKNICILIWNAGYKIFKYHIKFIYFLILQYKIFKYHIHIFFNPAVEHYILIIFLFICLFLKEVFIFFPPHTTVSFASYKLHILLKIYSN